MYCKAISKCVMSFILATMIIISGSSNVLAEDISGEAGISGVVPVSGDITPVTITVSVPTTITFVFNPVNPDNPDIPVSCASIPVVFSNSSTVGVSIDFLGFKAKKNNRAKVVNYDRFSDWSQLGSADTERNIALGIINGTNTCWSSGNLKSFDNSKIAGSFFIDSKTEQPTNKEISLVVKSGSSWSKVFSLGYEMGMQIKIV